MHNDTPLLPLQRYTLEIVAGGGYQFTTTHDGPLVMAKDVSALEDSYNLLAGAYDRELERRVVAESTLKKTQHRRCPR